MRIGNVNSGVITHWTSCSPKNQINPLGKPEFDCGGTLANGIIYSRSLNNASFGVCSTGILTDCNCWDTSLQQMDMHSSKYFSGSLIASTQFNIVLNETATQVQTNISSLTDTYSHVCGDKTGRTWCGTRELVIWDTDNNMVYDMT
jgi:hypothetical protein